MYNWPFAQVLILKKNNMSKIISRHSTIPEALLANSEALQSRSKENFDPIIFFQYK